MTLLKMLKNNNVNHFHAQNMLTHHGLVAVFYFVEHTSYLLYMYMYFVYDFKILPHTKTYQSFYF